MNEKLVWFDEPPKATEPLSRERIVTAAIELADQEPTGEITMRALAAKVGTRSPMALYRYVGNKDGLADLMADQIYGQFSVRRGHGWKPALRELGTSGWAAVQQHPWFARLAFSRPPLGPHTLDVYEAVLAELEPLGLPAATRMGFVNTVLGHVLGTGLTLLEERTMRARSGLATEEELGAAAAPYLAKIAAAGKHPHFMRWFEDSGRDENQPQDFETILDWLLAGLSTMVSSAGASGDR